LLIAGHFYFQYFSYQYQHMAAAKKPATKSTTTASRKNVPAQATTKEKRIKYEDKSAGQPTLVPIFDKLKSAIKKFSSPSLTELDSQPGAYSLLSKKQPVILGKEREIYFAGAMVQKGYIGFYFFPIYTDPDFSKELQPELLKCLKGKSCFHIKKDDEQLFTQIEAALAKGYKLYESKGWV
jgi:hypothetical protein